MGFFRSFRIGLIALLSLNLNFNSNLDGSWDGYILNIFTQPTTLPDKEV